MTLQLLHSEFLIYEENFIFIFISVLVVYGRTGRSSSSHLAFGMLTRHAATPMRTVCTGGSLALPCSSRTTYTTVSTPSSWTGCVIPAGDLIAQKRNASATEILAAYSNWGAVYGNSSSNTRMAFFLMDNLFAPPISLESHTSPPPPPIKKAVLRGTARIGYDCHKHVCL